MHSYAADFDCTANWSIGINDEKLFFVAVISTANQFYCQRRKWVNNWKLTQHDIILNRIATVRQWNEYCRKRCDFVWFSSLSPHRWIDWCVFVPVYINIFKLNHRLTSSVHTKWTSCRQTNVVISSLNLSRTCIHIFESVSVCCFFLLSSASPFVFYSDISFRVFQEKQTRDDKKEKKTRTHVPVFRV